MLRLWLCAAALTVALGACGADEPRPVADGRVVVMKMLPDGPLFFEGSRTHLRITGADGEVVADSLQPMHDLARPLYASPVPAGPYVLTSVERPCSAACPAMDPPAEKTRCEVAFEVRPNATTQVAIVLTTNRRGRVGAECTTETLSKAEYQRALFGILESAGGLSNAYTDLVVRRRPKAQCARMMRRFLRNAILLIESVSDLRAPADAAPVQRRFVLAAHESLERVFEINDAVAAGEISCGRELNANLYGLPSARSAEAAMAELEKLGYHLGLK